MKRWLIWAILLFAFALRMIALNTRPVWYDEAFAFFLAEKNLAAIASGTSADTMPPLYYWLLHFWIPFSGTTPFGLRMLSVAISMLIVALIFAIATHAFGARAGRFAALFAALAPFQMYHAQEMRMYAPLALGSLVYLSGVLIWTQTNADKHRPRSVLIRVAPRPLVLVALGTAIALYSHNLAAVTLLVANVYFTLRRDWRVLAKLIAAQFVGALAFLPWLFYLPTQIAKIQRAFWTQPPGIADVLQMLVVFTTYLPLPGIVFAGALFVSLMVAAIVALELVRWSRRGAPRVLGLFVAFALVPPALLVVLSYLMRPVFVPRGAIASSLAYYVLLAGLGARAPRPARIAIIALAGLVAIGTLPFYYSAWGEWRRAPFDQADQFLRAQKRQDDLILHDNKLSSFPMRFYDRTLPQEFLADPPGSANDTFARGSQEAMGLFSIEWDAAARKHPRVWFVIFQTALDEAASVGQPHGNLSQLDATMQRVDVTVFGDLRIYLYETR